MAFKCKSADGFYGWINLGVMFLFNMASMLVMMSFSYFLPSWVDEFVWSRGIISGSQTLNLILMGLAAPMVGILIMKTGSKRAIIIGNIINLLGLILLAYMSEMWQLYMGYGVIIGFGLSIGGMLGTFTILNNWFVMKRTLALSLSGASMGLSGVLFMPALMALIQHIGWRSTYLVIAGAVLICCIIIPAFLLVNTPAELGQVPDGPASKRMENEDQLNSSHSYRTPVDFTAKEAMRTKTLWLLVAYNTFQMLAMGGLMTHQIAFLYDIGIPQNNGVYDAFQYHSREPWCSCHRFYTRFTWKLYTCLSDKPCNAHPCIFLHSLCNAACAPFACKGRKQGLDIWRE